MSNLAEVGEAFFKRGGRNGDAGAGFDTSANTLQADMAQMGGDRGSEFSGEQRLCRAQADIRMVRHIDKVDPAAAVAFQKIQAAAQSGRRRALRVRPHVAGDDPREMVAEQIAEGGGSGRHREQCVSVLLEFGESLAKCTCRL